MSATFKLAKKKHTQDDLRRLMKEHNKPKLLAATKRIESPLAKYNELGQLICILCKSVVRSENVWKIHVNTKQHKQSIEEAKQLKLKTNNFTAPAQKRPATPPTILSEQPTKKIKSILKNSSASATHQQASAATTAESKHKNSEIPSDFFDVKPSSSETKGFFETTLQKTSIRNDLLNIKREPKSTNVDGADGPLSNADAADDKDETLPEGFFDDPVKDAKARNLEYKDPVEEEWDRFQKEIKAAADFSNAIIAEDQEEATAERQIDEIDEQIRNWSRVLNLEKKKEVVEKGKQTKIELTNKIKARESESSAEEDNDDFDEYLDWRAKRSHK